MSLTIVPTPEFKKSVKRLFKRYKHIAKDLADLEIIDEKKLVEILAANGLG